MRVAKIFGLESIPPIKANDNLAQLITDSLWREKLFPKEHDILVVTHKIVSKAEGRSINLKEVKPGEKAVELAGQTGKDPRLIELILRESIDVLRVSRGLIITRHKLGYVCANAGIDRSNSGQKASEHVVLLPKDPDKSARKIRKIIYREFAKDVAVVIIDSHGRPFRNGAIGVALGFSGLIPLHNFIGKKDLNGYILKSSIEGFADELASSATLLMGQSDEGIPVVLVRGIAFQGGDSDLSVMIRDPEKDLFL